MALGMEPDVSRAVDAAKQNSFLARLSLLDPRAVDPETADRIAGLLEGVEGDGRASGESVGAGGSVGGADGGAKDSGEGEGGGEGDGEAVQALYDLLKQLVWRDPGTAEDPNANMLANGVRPLGTGRRLSLHSSVESATQFPMWVRGDDDSVVSAEAHLGLDSAATSGNPFYDSGVLQYYLRAGGVSPPTPFSGRKVLAAAVWYV